MTDQARIPPADLRLWAAAQLGIPPDAPRAEFQREFLKRLQDASFVPPLTWPEAFHVLAGDVTDAAGTDEATKAPAFQVRQAAASAFLEPQRRGEVDRFCAAFFSLAPSERRAQWLALQERCAPFPRLRERLSGLRAGLDVEPSRMENRDPLVVELGRKLCELFVLPPGQRAAARRDLLERYGPLAGWRRAARTLQARHGDIARLETHGLRQLEEWSLAQDRLARARASPRPRPDPPRSAQRQGQSGFPTWTVVLVLMIASSLARGCNTVYHQPARPQYGAPLAPSYRSPQYKADERLQKLLNDPKIIQESEALRRLYGLPPPDEEASAADPVEKSPNSPADASPASPIPQ